MFAVGYVGTYSWWSLRCSVAAVRECLAGMPGVVRMLVWFLNWNRGSPFYSKKKI
jgi:hypothetical protein